MNQVVSVVGKFFRSTGKTLDGIGAKFEGKYAYIERLNPSTRLVGHKGTKPKIGVEAFIAPNASLVGNVELGNKSSVWYGSIIKGDSNKVSIGDFTNIQDNAAIYSTSKNPTKIGNSVTIGANTRLQSCTVGDHSIIGTGAQVLDGAIIGKNAMVAAASSVSQGAQVADGQLWSGNPAVYLRDLAPEEIDFIKSVSTDAVEMAKLHQVECAKTFEELEAEKDKLIAQAYGEDEEEETKQRTDTGFFFRY